MWATELKPLMEHAIEPLMATKRATPVSKITPVANLSSRQKGDGRGVGVPRQDGGVPFGPVTFPKKNDPVCDTSMLRTASANWKDSVHLHSALLKVTNGRPGANSAFKFAFGLSNVRASAFDERTRFPAHELRSHHHRRRRRGEGISASKDVAELYVTYSAQTRRHKGGPGNHQ